MTLKTTLQAVIETKYRVIDNEDNGFYTIDVDYLAPSEEFIRAIKEVRSRNSRKVKFIRVNTTTNILEILLS